LRWDGAADTMAVRARTAKQMWVGREGNIVMVEVLFFGRVAVVGGHGRRTCSLRMEEVVGEKEQERRGRVIYCCRCVNKAVWIVTVT
jgi:hypothetical protein